MNRREMLATLGGVAMTASATGGADQHQLPLFWTSRLSDVEQAVQQVKKGSVRTLAQSPGKRPVHLVSYGAKQDRQGRANYNSACGGSDPASYSRKDGTQRPVIFLLGPVHGGEFEGTVGLLNLLHIAETGADLRGGAWQQLADNFAKCRVLIVPCGNPDGRARCSRDSSVGEELDSIVPSDMGVKLDGSPYSWPGVKRIHPMRPGQYRALGSYFNDDGVNLMHDEWFAPMAAETKAFFALARDEAPDYIVSLHSHASLPSLESTAYVPRTVKVAIKQIGDRVQKRYADAGLPHRTAGGPEPAEDGMKFPPPSFNLCSALHHACGAAAFVHECCVGVKTPPYPKLTHEQLLEIELLFFDELFRYAVQNPVKWTK